MFILAIASIFFFRSRIKFLSEESSRLRIEFLANQIQQATFIDLSNNYEKIKPHLEKIDQAIPEEKNILPFINEIENLATNKQLIQNFKFEKVGESSLTPIFKEARFSLTLYGNLSQFLDYLKSFEEIPYFVKIDSVNFSGTPSLTDFSEMRLKGVLYVE